jgi:hypothetical protein
MKEVMTNRLAESEVGQRLAECKERPQIVDELYSFGQALVRQAVEDIHRIDLKAGSFAAYCGVVITLLVSSQGSWSKMADGWVYLSVIGSGSAALVGAIFSISALALRNFEWFSQKEWLETSCFDDLTKLKRYRVLTMWGVVTSYRDAHAVKVRRLVKAQWFLVAAGCFLLVALIAGLRDYYLGHNLGLTGR